MIIRLQKRIDPKRCKTYLSQKFLLQILQIQLECSLRDIGPRGPNSGPKCAVCPSPIRDSLSRSTPTMSKLSLVCLLLLAAAIFVHGALLNFFPAASPKLACEREKKKKKKKSKHVFRFDFLTLCIW
jgi:hypothetical protein